MRAESGHTRVLPPEITIYDHVTTIQRSRSTTVISRKDDVQYRGDFKSVTKTESMMKVMKSVLGIVKGIAVAQLAQTTNQTRSR